MASLVGGQFVARHFGSRFILWTYKLAPVNYVSFLDHAVKRVFLLRVGGGYIFIHRMVMEYFASLNQWN